MVCRKSVLQNGVNEQVRSEDCGIQFQKGILGLKFGMQKEEESIFGGIYLYYVDCFIKRDGCT